MATKNLIYTLAKVIIAAAWADGKITNEEENSLKDLLYRLPQIGKEGGIQLTTHEWQTLEMYMHSPIDPDERARLVEDLQIATRTFEDKKLIFDALNQMATADGEIDDAERAVISEIKASINGVNTHVLNQMGKLVGFAMQRRSKATANSFNREKYLNDFVKNKVFYAASRRLRRENFSLDLPEKQLRKLSLAGGLMAKVAHVDLDVTDEEFEHMAAALRENWGVDEETAVFIAEVAVSEVADRLDHHRTVRQFGLITTPKEREQFIRILFAIADADGFVSNEEIEEIRAISSSMNVLHKVFIDAKLQIPKERRES